jgi:hypothetical protein
VVYFSIGVRTKCNLFVIFKSELINYIAILKFDPMSKCSFSVPFSGNPESVLAKAKTGITGAGGQFTGDASGGEFSLSTFVGAIAGTFTFSASNLNIEITDKPLFLSCSQIEKELKKNLMV